MSVRIMHAHRLPSRIARPALGAALALALVVGMPSSLAAQAAAPSPLPALRQAMASVTSYQVDMTVTSGAASKVTLVVVGKGKNTRMHITTTVAEGPGKTVKVDAIIIGSRVCVHIPGSGPAHYTCQNSPALAAQLNQNPAKTFQTPAGTTITFARIPGPGKFVKGRICDGYTFTTVAKTGRATGTLYLSHLNSRICEEDATSKVTLPTTGKTVSATVKAIWTRYNDPTLTVPAVPAGQ